MYTATLRTIFSDRLSLYSLFLQCQHVESETNRSDLRYGPTHQMSVLLDFSLTVKAAPHECVIRTSQP